jgi:hypothetical protein
MRVVAAHRGWMWFSQGWALFRRSPIGWVGLVLTYWLLIAMLNVIPYVGSVLSTLSLPAFSVSFMIACFEVEKGSRPSLRMVFAGFQHRASTLLVLGGLYLISILFVLGVTALVDDGALFRWIVLNSKPGKAALEDGTVLRGLLLASVIATPTLMAFWFSPVLAAWQNMGAGKAMFYSFFAGLRNWRAFAVYGMVVAVAGLVISLAVTVLAIVARGNPDILSTAMLVLTIVFLPTLFASFYYSYRDVFGEDASPAAVPAAVLADPPAGP